SFGEAGVSTTSPLRAPPALRSAVSGMAPMGRLPSLSALAAAGLASGRGPFCPRGAFRRSLRLACCRVCCSRRLGGGSPLPSGRPSGRRSRAPGGCRRTHIQFDRHLARNRIGHSQIAAEILQRVAHPIEVTDHFGARFYNRIEALPLAEEAVAPFARLDDHRPSQAVHAHAIERLL